MNATRTTEPTTRELTRLHSAAEICRLKGWERGTRLVGNEGYGPTIIEITAVGDRRILAKRISHNGEPDKRSDESTWTLGNRDWQLAPTPTNAEHHRTTEGSHA